MKPKTARRFLNRSKWKIAASQIKSQSRSFWARVEKCQAALKLEAYKALSGSERIFRMLGFQVRLMVKLLN